MTMYPVEAILFRKLTSTDWKAINGQLARANAGGERHIALDKITTDSYTSKFLRTTSQPHTVNINAIGLAQAEHPVVFKDWGGNRNQWTVADQYNNRHPAISTEYGFPEYREEFNQTIIVYWVRCSNSKFFMGYVLADNLPSGWPSSLNPMFNLPSNKNVGLIELTMPPLTSITQITSTVLSNLGEHKNILLYGPPGTGKTHAMQELFTLLSQPVSTDAQSGIMLNPANQQQPFSFVNNPVDLVQIPRPIYVDWITFHQGMTYEEFVVGLRPIPFNNGIKLEPRAGRFLEAVRHVVNENGSAVLFIDELNRGNPAQILGELITFLEVEKRKLPFYLPGIDAGEENGSKFYEISFRADKSKLPYPLLIPENIYIIASMNSLDRSVAPLDQALARRFARLSCVPDVKELKMQLGQSEVDNQEINASKIAFHLFRRINEQVRHTIGTDFEFGHGYFAPVWAADESDRIGKLASVWDNRIYPQLEELYRTRIDELSRILRVGDASKPNDYPYNLEEFEASPGQIVFNSSIGHYPEENQQRFLAFLAGLSL